MSAQLNHLRMLAEASPGCGRPYRRLREWGEPLADRIADAIEYAGDQ